ncbi:MAG: hexose kinase [Clostridia bacterium]|nr:hexose kinase [Clostridia bacterium]
MKIAVITLNPGVDRIVYLPTPLHPGTMNRSTHTVMNQGSKGANQAMMLSSLGEEPVYYSFTGGAMGDFCESFTREQGIPSRMVPTACGVRLNIKVIDSEGGCTELNEKGGPVTEEELGQMLMALQNDIRTYDMVSLCGSIPQGVEKSVYNSIITMVREAGVPAVLDCDGEALSLGLQAKPMLIKPNRRELAGLIGENEEKLKDVDFLVEACGKVVFHYDTDVICTLDEDGSVFVGKSGVWKVGVAKVPLRGFSGAGDTYLSAYLHKRYGERCSEEESLRYAAAASCAKIAKEGTTLPSPSEIDALLTEISVEKIK